MKGANAGRKEACPYPWALAASPRDNVFPLKSTLSLVSLVSPAFEGKITYGGVRTHHEGGGIHMRACIEMCTHNPSYTYLLLGTLGTLGTALILKVFFVPSGNADQGTARDASARPRAACEFVPPPEPLKLDIRAYVGVDERRHASGFSNFMGSTKVNS